MTDAASLLDGAMALSDALKRRAQERDAARRDVELALALSCSLLRKAWRSYDPGRFQTPRGARTRVGPRGGRYYWAGRDESVRSFEAEFQRVAGTTWKEATSKLPPESLERVREAARTVMRYAHINELSDGAVAAFARRLSTAFDEMDAGSGYAATRRSRDANEALTDATEALSQSLRGSRADRVVAIDRAMHAMHDNGSLAAMVLGVGGRFNREGDVVSLLLSRLAGEDPGERDSRQREAKRRGMARESDYSRRPSARGAARDRARYREVLAHEMMPTAERAAHMRALSPYRQRQESDWYDRRPMTLEEAEERVRRYDAERR